MYKLLLVDDPRVLSSLRRVLLRKPDLRCGGLEIENKVPADLARRKKNESREDPRWKKET